MRPQGPEGLVRQAVRQVVTGAQLGTSVQHPERVDDVLVGSVVVQVVVPQDVTAPAVR
jgi:hypothetical protein